MAGPLVNQLGFAPNAEKTVVYPGSDANGLEVRDLKGKTVLKLKAPMVYDWEYSGEEVQTFDISALKTPGTYRLFRGGEYVGTPIVVGKPASRALLGTTSSRSSAASRFFFRVRQRVCAPCRSMNSVLTT